MNSRKSTDHFSGSREELGFASRAIHRGLDWCEETGAVVPPVYLTSTFRRGNPGGFDYTRSGNPNFRNLEQTLADLEGARFSTVFSSGVAAITAVIASLKSGDVVLAEENIYGCTFRLFREVFEKFGVRIRYLDFTNALNFSRIVEERPVLVWIESPTNPLLKVIDIEQVALWSHRAGAALLVDNTFASSYLQQPLALGASLSLFSTTKYTGGHSDCLGGAVCTNWPVWQERLQFAQKALGLNPAPLDVWLVQRGLKTLAIRMRQHSENALALARYLRECPWVQHVYYPHLDSHPQFALATRQMKLGSGIIAAELRLSFEQTLQLLGSLRLFTLAESLGGVESLVCHPATMTHAAVPPDVRARVGISDTLVRFSVGIEDAEDLQADLETAARSVKQLQPGAVEQRVRSEY
ncbi:MAG: PLP-dependent transferase [Bdellovibrionales bacterium]|nr:PLP-dependent transferase [Bdellovibrionales bacterium]